MRGGKDRLNGSDRYLLRYLSHKISETYLRRYVLETTAS